MSWLYSAYLTQKTCPYENSSYPSPKMNIPPTTSSRRGTNKDLLETGGFSITAAAIFFLPLFTSSEMN
jgi:hypothetical protein